MPYVAKPVFAAMKGVRQILKQYMNVPQNLPSDQKHQSFYKAIQLLTEAVTHVKRQL